METFWYLLTQVHLENGRQNGQSLTATVWQRLRAEKGVTFFVIHV